MATFKKILITFDGSEACKKAAEKALELAADQGAEAIGVKVIAFSFETIAPSDSLWETIMSDLKEKANHVMDELEAMAKEKGVPFVRDIRDGVIEHEIIDSAKEHGADLVVLGIGSREARLGRFLGKGQQRLSVRTLARDIDCPLLVVG